VSKEDFIRAFEAWIVLMQQALEHTDLPEHANLDKINTMLHEVYLEGWQTKWWETK
jgi:hypothetical protein